MNVAETPALRALFFEARSQNGWRDDVIDDDDIRDAYDIARWGPTSGNCQPMRLLLLRSAEAKERLKPALAPGNVSKALSAPVLAIIAFDIAFHREMPRLFPHRPEAGQRYVENPRLAELTAFRNGSLQAGYFMLALRAVGLDVGPMSGFDTDQVDATFFSDSSWRTNFLCGIGRGDLEKIHQRLPRLDFADAARFL